MGLSLRSTSSGHNGVGGTSITINVPAGVQDGDLMVLAVQTPNNNISSSTGWTFLQQIVAGTTLSTYYRVASSEPASYTFSLNASVEATYIVLDYSGAGSPYTDGISINSGGSSTNLVASANSAGQAGEQYVAFFAGLNTGSIGAPTSLTTPAVPLTLEATATGSPNPGQVLIAVDGSLGAFTGTISSSTAHAAPATVWAALAVTLVAATVSLPIVRRRPLRQPPQTPPPQALAGCPLRLARGPFHTGLAPFHPPLGRRHCRPQVASPPTAALGGRTRRLRRGPLHTGANAKVVVIRAHHPRLPPHQPPPRALDPARRPHNRPAHPGYLVPRDRGNWLGRHVTVHRPPERLLDGKSKRIRHAGLGQSARSFVVPNRRRRSAARGNRPPPYPGRHHRNRLILPAQANSLPLVRPHRRRPAVAVPWAPGRHRRGRLVGRGAAVPPVRRHRTSALRSWAVAPWARVRARVPTRSRIGTPIIWTRWRRRRPPKDQATPFAGRHRRGRLVGRGTAAFRVRPHRTARPVNPPPQPGRHRRIRLAGTGRTWAPLVRRPRIRRGGNIAPAPWRGMHRRGRLAGTGLSPLPVVRRHRLSFQPSVPWPALWGRARRGRGRGTGPFGMGGVIVTGPYYAVAGDLYCGGAVVGDLVMS